jgi:hypothetical protein
MFDYIDSSGNTITYDQITKMAKEGKTSFDAIVKKNGYKPKPKANKAKSGAELLGIDTTTTKKAAVAKKTVTENIPTFKPSSDPFAGTNIAQPTKSWSFREEGISPNEKARKEAEIKAKEKEKAKTTKEQLYLDQTKDYRTRQALDELSFDNPNNIDYDINKESTVETVNNLNKKINRLGLEAEEFGEEIIFRKIGESEGYGGTKNGTFFKLSDVKGMNKFISNFGDKTYYKKIKEIAKTKYPDLWEKITPPVLTAKDKKEQATKGLIEEFKRLEGSEASYSMSINAVKEGATAISKDLFSIPGDYELYKQWKKNPNGIIELPDSRVEAWDKSRKEKFIDRASTDYARSLEPEDRKNLQILTQEKVNDVRYATKGLIKDINDYKVKEKNWNTEVELYAKNPTPEKLKVLKADALSLIEEQNNIGNKQKELQKESEYASTVLAPAITAFGANYNRINQLQNAAESMLVNVAATFDDIAAYGSSAILGVKQQEIIKNDTLGIMHTASELSKQKQRYQKAVGIDEIDSIDDAGNWLMSSTVNALPSIGMAFTGAAALPLFFASGYGGKATQMALEAEEAKKRLSENYYEINNTTDEFAKAQLQQQIDADEKLLSLPEYKKFIAKSLFGTAEVGFEMLGTLQILKGVGSGIRTLPKKTLREGMVWGIKNAVKNYNREGLSELGTTLTDNFVDIHVLGENKNFFEGGLESYTQGGLMGTGFGAVETYNVMKRAISSELAAKKQSRRMQDIANQISELTGIQGYKLDQSIPLPLQTPAVQKLVNELVDESESIESNIIGRLGVDLTLEQATQVGDVNRQIREVNKDFLEAAKDPNLSPDQLKTLETYYRNKFNELVNQREALLTDTTIKENNIKANKEARFEFDLTQGYQMYNTKMQRASLNKVVGNFNNLNTNAKNDLLIEAKNELELESGGDTKEITKEEIEDRALTNYVTTHYSKAIKDGLKNAETFAKGLGLDLTIREFEGPNADEEIIAAYNESDATNAQKKEFIEEVKSGSVEGVPTKVGGKDVILIHTKNSAKRGRVGVGAHEVLHVAIKKAFSDQSGIDKAGKNLLQYLETYDPNLYAQVTARIDSSYVEREKVKVKTKDGKLKEANLRVRDENGDLIKDETYYEEALNALSDIASDGIDLPKDSLNSIRNFINNLLPKGFPKFKENQGADVYQFIKDYNREAHFGKKKAANLINFSGKIIGGDQERSTFSKTSKELKAELEDLEENVADYDPDDFDQQVRNLESKIKKAIEKEKAGVVPVVKKEVTEEETDKEIIKNEKGSVSSDKVQKIYEEQGVNGAQAIIDLFKPITKKLVNKRMDAPGFDRELLTSEIETGDGGLFYLIKSYKPETGVPLAAYINKQLPLRAIAASRRILDKDFSKDVTEEKGLMAEETVSEAKEKPKYKNALESNIFSSEILKTATGKIITIVRTLKNRIDAPVTLNRTVTPLISEIRDEVGKQLDIDLKTMLGGKKDGVFRKELLRTKRYILENMTTTWLMGKDGQGGIPQAIQKQIDGKWVSYPDWVGQKIDREKTTTDNAGRTSGAELVRRLPNVFNNVPDEVFLGQFIGPDGNPIRGRKESVSKAMAEEGAFDIINADFAEEGPIFQAFATNQERLGYEIATNTINEFVRQSDRGNIKFSKTYDNFSELQKELFNKNINKLSKELNPFLNNINRDLSINKAFNNVFKNLLIGNKPAFTESDINNLIKDFIPWLRQMRDIDKANERFLEDENFDFNKFLKNIAELNEYFPLDILGMPGVEQKLFTAANVNNARETSRAMISHWNETLGSEEAMKMALYLTLTFSGNTSLGNSIGLDVDKNGIVFETNIKGKRSGQIAKNSKDYWDNIVFPSFSNLNNKEKAELKEKIRIETLDVRRRDSASRAYKDKDWEIRKTEAEYHQKIVQRIFEFYFDKNNNIPDTDKAIMVKQMGSNMQSVMKKSAILTYEFVKNEKDESVGPLRYEHTRPANKVSGDILKAYMESNGKPSEEALKSIWKTFEASLIPVSMDDNFRPILLEANMNPGWKAGDPVYYRYYNYATFGKPNMYPIANVFTGEIIGEKFVEASNAMINGVENGKKIEAVTNSLTNFSKTPQGISVFDFDDTVGLTKGSVLYTMPGDQIVYHGAPKGKDVTKISDKGVKFFATDIREADEYARMNSGTTQQFVINNSQVVDENVAINKMKELGLTPKNKEFEIDDAQFYELIDTRFEESLSRPDITKLFDALKKDGVKALSYNDGAQVSGKSTTSIAVIDPSIISTPKKLNAEEFAKNGSNLLAEGAVFDFSEFSKVVDGKPGPMVEKMKKMISKFGPSNFFILTARPPAAAGPIHEFLTSIGIDIPLENITGLGNSTAQAKADWMVAKAAEGYNDFYFADDAPQNVKAVQDALDVLDVKSKIQQAKLKFSKTMSDDFNRIIEENKGVESYKVFSDITARRRGIKKNRFDFYVPPSAADFELLLYNFMGKGALGEEHKKFFQDALINPYINGVDMMGAVRQSIKKEYKALLKSFPEVRKDLEKLTPNKDFTYDQAMRVAIWSQYGTEIPGLSQRDITYLTDLINNDPELAAFKDGLIVMGRQKEGWLPPGNFWDSDTIVSDLYNITEGSGRKKFLAEFIENTENIFGKFEDGRLSGPNINKVEAVYGTNVREALEDSIYRMINGKNRSFGQDKETTAWSSWVNGSTGAIMFLNTRSAALQMLGAVNFLNWRDNNPFNAGKAFLNQPQYWKDFSRIWNSDKLKERRGGLREDVASAEIANAAAGSKNKVVAVTSYLLKIGYTPTQLADSFAIASGGAPFYRNRINSYLKEGLTEQEAESKAWKDFSKISDETQQSGDPKDISKQQSSAAGRILLVFQNFTMQQSRIVKKAVLDLKNGRGDAKTNIAKIAYYLAVQNIMFSTLQQGLFAVMFDDDDEEDKKKKEQKKTKTDAAMDVANGVLDSILRGTGFVGGVTATLKNTVIKYLEERAKKQKAEYAKVVLEAANMSPPIGSKLRKTYSALQQTKYDKDLIEARGWGVMQDGRVHLGPMYSVTGKLVEVGTNFPMDRLVNKVENVSQAFNSENTAMQRLATGMGYSPWTVGIEGTKGDILIKETAKATRKEEGLIKAKETRRENAERLKDSIEGLSVSERQAYRRKIALEKKERRIQRAKEKREEMRKRRKRRMGE